VELIKENKATTEDIITKKLGADGGRDIYDIQLVDGSVGLKDLAPFGYESQTSMSIGGKLKPPTDVIGHDELNGPLCEPSAKTIGSCDLNTNKKYSRKILVLRRDNAIKAFAKASAEPSVINSAAFKLPDFKPVSKFNHPISDATLVELPRHGAEKIDRKPCDKALSQGWRLVTLLAAKTGANQINPDDLFDMRNAHLPTNENDFKNIVESANLNAGDTSAPIVLLFIRRGGATPLEDIVSLPFHALLDGKKDVKLDSSDFALAETDAASNNNIPPQPKQAKKVCRNLITPKDCTVEDTATQKKPLTHLVGLMTRFVR
jgi:hypothetical protein